jgi:hypothetical protein
MIHLPGERQRITNAALRIRINGNGSRKEWKKNRPPLRRGRGARPLSGATSFGATDLATAKKESMIAATITMPSVCVIYQRTQIGKCANSREERPALAANQGEIFLTNMGKRNLPQDGAVGRDELARFFEKKYWRVQHKDTLSR